jgi:S-DNA-T family DNA segregation ATPase FtsK/SpoIIIE
LAATAKTSGKKPVKKTTSKTKKTAAKARQVKMPEIKGIILLFIGIFLLFCAYWGGGGKIGGFVTKLLVLLFGAQGRTVLAVAMIVHGVMLFARSQSFVNARGALFLYIFALNIITALGLAFNILKNNESLFSSATYQYITASKAVGGIVGQCLARLYINLLSAVGAWLLILCVTIVLFLVVYRKSLSDKIRSKIDAAKAQRETRREAARQERGRQLMFTSFEDEAAQAAPKAKAASFGLSSFEDDAPAETARDKKSARLDSFENEKPLLAASVKEAAAAQSRADFDEDAPAEKNPQKKSDYVFPPLKLLDLAKSKTTGAERQEVVANAASLEKTLSDFGVDAKVSEIAMGPTVTRYELQLQPGIRVSKVVSLSDDIAMALAAQRVRIEAPIPGKSAIGIEVPNKEIAVVKLSHILASQEFKNSASPQAVALGKMVSGEVLIMDITKMPHILIAGETGSGKSVCLHTIIMSILYHSAPDDVRIILIDPKMVEFPDYNDIPHLLIPVVTDAKLAASSLAWAVREMTSRYESFAETRCATSTATMKRWKRKARISCRASF